MYGVEFSASVEMCIRRLFLFHTLILIKKENYVKDYGNVTEQWLVCWLENLKEGRKKKAWKRL